MKYTAAYLLLGTLLTLGLACGEQETADELYSKAQGFEQQENYEEALHAYEKLTKLYPEDESADNALQKAAFIYYNNINDFHKSIEYHKALVADYPGSEFVQQARFMVGFIYANNLNDLDKAKDAYSEFLKLHPDSELADDVEWELKHLGQDVNEQMLNLLGSEQSNGDEKTN